MGVNHIEVTEAFVRFYVFLAQSLDRCVDQEQRESFPEKDHQAFLTDTRTRLMELLEVNPVVKAKVEEEGERVLALASSGLRPVADKSFKLDELKSEREMLRTKLLVLSDLLAVFRAL